MAVAPSSSVKGGPVFSGWPTWWTLAALIVYVTLLAMALFVMRQQRLELMNQITTLHSHIQDHRQGMWDMQTRIAQQTQPLNLQRAIREAHLELETATPAAPPNLPLLTAAQHAAPTP